MVAQPIPRSILFGALEYQPSIMSNTKVVRLLCGFAVYHFLFFAVLDMDRSIDRSGG